MQAFLRMYTGRLSRLQYFFLSLIVAFAITAPVRYFLTSTPEIPWVASIILATAISVLTAWHLVVRRLHDIGLNGWWILIFMLPDYLYGIGMYVNLILLVLLILIHGTSGENAYGHPAPTSRGLTNSFLNRHDVR